MRDQPPRCRQIPGAVVGVGREVAAVLNFGHIDCVVEPPFEVGQRPARREHVHLPAVGEPGRIVLAAHQQTAGMVQVVQDFIPAAISPHHGQMLVSLDVAYFTAQFGIAVQSRRLQGDHKPARVRGGHLGRFLRRQVPHDFPTAKSFAPDVTRWRVTAAIWFGGPRGGVRPPVSGQFAQFVQLAAGAGGRPHLIGGQVAHQAEITGVGVCLVHLDAGIATGVLLRIEPVQTVARLLQPVKELLKGGRCLGQRSVCFSAA